MEALPETPLKKPQTPLCDKCETPMGLIYELDVPVLANYRDTHVRKRHEGYACRGCFTVAWTLDGRVQEKPKPTKMPKNAHPRMLQILVDTLKGYRMAKD